MRGICKLKKSTYARGKSSRSNVISGIKSCSGKVTTARPAVTLPATRPTKPTNPTNPDGCILMDTIYAGHVSDKDACNVKTWRECHLLCQQRTTCFAFSYITGRYPVVSLRGNCRFKNRNYQQGKARKAGVISGSKQCKVGPTRPTRPTRPTPPVPGKSTCGQQWTSHTSHRIVGGQPAKPGEWPWQIGLWRRSSSGGVSGRHPFCGGILIRPNVVLTAAHCIKQPPSFYAVNVGDYDVTTKGPQEEAVKVSRIYRHEGYKPRVTRKMQNDIALLVLEKHVPLKAQVNIACMPTKKDIEGECFATGWGRLKEGGRQSNVLQEVKLPIVPMEDCKKAYGSKITDGMICAGLKNGGKDSCQGDSGGPLVCRKSINSEIWELRGITSFGHGCARAGKYGVYTEAYHYNAWIQDKILRSDVDEAMDELQGLQDALQSIP